MFYCYFNVLVVIESTIKTCIKHRCISVLYEIRGRVDVRC